MHDGLAEPVGCVRAVSAIEQRGPWMRVFRSGVTLAGGRPAREIEQREELSARRQAATTAASRGR